MTTSFHAQLSPVPLHLLITAAAAHAAAEEEKKWSGGIYRDEEVEAAAAWVEESEKEWDWVAVWGMKVKGRAGRRKYWFKVQWDRRDGGGSQWVREDDCAIARVWDWLMLEKVHYIGDIEQEWDQWKEVVVTKRKASHSERPIV